MTNRLLPLCLCVFAVAGTMVCGYAVDLDPLKADLMAGDYKAAIAKGEKMLATSEHDKDADGLYYFLGLCYFKDGNYLRASDIFEIIIKEFKGSRYEYEAKLGLADTYFARGDLENAKAGYLALLNDNAAVALRVRLYSRLGQCEARLGNAASAKDYLDKLSRDFPLNMEAGMDSCPLPGSGFYYSVQVGSFANKANAENLIRQLERKGYSAYIEEALSQGNPVYRVRSGKFVARQEALELEARLSKEGYPTKICP